MVFLVFLIDLLEIQWVLEFYFILEMTLQLNFWNMILELILNFFSVQVNLQKVKWFFNDSHNLHKNKLLND